MAKAAQKATAKASVKKTSAKSKKETEAEAPMKKAAAKTAAAKKTPAKKTPAKKTAIKKAAAKKTPKKEVVAEDQVIAEAPVPVTTEAGLLNFESVEVKRMIAVSKKSGLLTTKELNKYLNMEAITPEAIEITLAQLSEMGISVIEEKDEPTIGSKTLARTETTAVKGGNSKEELDRTDDPVRMYLREMGTVELLSREGEIAIAKRIEAGRDTMIKGLC